MNNLFIKVLSIIVMIFLVETTNIIIEYEYTNIFFNIYTDNNKKYNGQIKNATNENFNFFINCLQNKNVKMKEIKDFIVLYFYSKMHNYKLVLYQENSTNNNINSNTTTIIEIMNDLNKLKNNSNNNQILIIGSPLIFYNKNIEYLDLSIYDNLNIIWSNLYKFNNLNKLTINTDNNINFKNIEIKELEIIYKINDFNYDLNLPNLEILTLFNFVTDIYIIKLLKIFPKIRILNVYNYKFNILQIAVFCKNNKIKINL